MTSFSDCVESLIDLVRRRHPLWWDAPEAELSDYFRWFWDRGFIGKSIDARGNCHALVVVRLMGNWQDFVDQWAYDRQGEFCWVEMTLSDNRQSLKEAVEELHQRHGEPKLMLWDRRERTEKGAPRMYTWKMFSRMMRNLFYA